MSNVDARNRDSKKKCDVKKEFTEFVTTCNINSIKTGPVHDMTNYAPLKFIQYTTN